MMNIKQVIFENKQKKLIQFKQVLQTMLENEVDIDYHIYKSFQIMGLVGKGTYGQVYKVRNKKTNQIFAIKKICDAYQNVTDAKRTYRQLNYLFQLCHPCIVKLYQVVPGNRRNDGQLRESNTSRTDFVKGVFDDHRMGYNTEKTHDGALQYNSKLSKHVYALFEYVETDLAKALSRCIMQPIQRKYIAYQLLQAMSYLHRSNLVHRDIKPSNILIDTNCDIKLCDFGLCRMKQQNPQQTDQNIITEYVASRWYRPPQILLGFTPCNEAIDIWGVGCVIAQLVLRAPLFQGQSTMDQLQKIFRIIGLPNQSQINKLQSDQAKFLLRTFTFSRKNKPQKISQVLSETTDQELDLIENLLKFNPDQRLSAQQALKHKYFLEMEQMNYNFNQYNIPVKIIDHTDSSFTLGSLRDLGKQGQDRKNDQKNLNKKKQITLQQYQNLIEDLERVTSRSSNRFYNEANLIKTDKITYENVEQDRANKQKSTRQSNFLIEHKMLVQNKKEAIEQSNQTSFNQRLGETKEAPKIIENYNKQKSCPSSNKNLKIADVVNESRNVYSSIGNYYSGVLHHKGSSKNDLFLPQTHGNMRPASKCNKSIEENLVQTYGISSTVLEKQGGKKPVKTHKKAQCTSILEDFKKKNVVRKSSTNKSHSKKSNDTLKDKSFAKNSSKNLNREESKNKHSSYTNLAINESNFLNQMKGKIPIYKKTKDLPKYAGKILKDFSKGKLGSQEKSQKDLIQKNHIKSLQSQELQKQRKDRKMSKEYPSRKTINNDENQQSLQNCFSKINLKEKQFIYHIEAKPSQQLKKKTVQKKGQKAVTSKSIGKKKSQAKILPHK